MDVSENSGTPKSSSLIGFSTINHPFWSTTIFGNTHIRAPASRWENHHHYANKGRFDSPENDPLLVVGVLAGPKNICCNNM